jgi:hypothetical protein
MLHAACCAPNARVWGHTSRTRYERHACRVHAPHHALAARCASRRDVRNCLPRSLPRLRRQFERILRTNSADAATRRLAEQLSHVRELDGATPTAIHRLAFVASSRTWSRGDLCLAFPPASSLGCAAYSAAHIYLILSGSVELLCNIGETTASKLARPERVTPHTEESVGVAAYAGAHGVTGVNGGSRRGGVDLGGKAAPPRCGRLDRHVGTKLVTVATLGEGELLAANPFGEGHSQLRWCLKATSAQLHLLELPKQAWYDAAKASMLDELLLNHKARAAFLFERVESSRAAASQRTSLMSARAVSCSALHLTTQHQQRTALVSTPTSSSCPRSTSPNTSPTNECALQRPSMRATWSWHTSLAEAKPDAEPDTHTQISTHTKPSVVRMQPPPQAQKPFATFHRTAPSLRPSSSAAAVPRLCGSFATPTLAGGVGHVTHPLEASGMCEAAGTCEAAGIREAAGTCEEQGEPASAADAACEAASMGMCKTASPDEPDPSMGLQLSLLQTVGSRGGLMTPPRPSSRTRIGSRSVSVRVRPWTAPVRDGRHVRTGGAERPSTMPRLTGSRSLATLSQTMRNSKDCMYAATDSGSLSVDTEAPSGSTVTFRETNGFRVASYMGQDIAWQLIGPMTLQG